MVTVHRVTLEESGPFDSIRSGADGRFEFDLPASPSGGTSHEIYFASVSIDGVLYFGAPVSDAAALDTLYRVEAFPVDTVGARPADLPVAVRNIFLDPTGEGDWFVTDLFEVRNDGVTTFVSDGNHPVFSYPLPQGAFQFEVGQSDLPEDAASFSGGSLHVMAPIPPGERMFLIRYRVPDLEITLDLPGTTEQFDLLAREPAEIEVTGLTDRGTQQVQPGQMYRNFSGANLVNAQVLISPSAGGGLNLGPEWIAVLFALLLGGAGVVAWHQGQARAAAAAGGAHGGPGPMATPVASQSGSGGTEPDPSRMALLLEIATLDEAYAGIENPSDEATQRYQQQRAMLTAQLMGGDR
jgi:hypothetical protein